MGHENLSTKIFKNIYEKRSSNLNDEQKKMAQQWFTLGYEQGHEIGDEEGFLRGHRTGEEEAYESMPTRTLDEDQLRAFSDKCFAEFRGKNVPEFIREFVYQVSGRIM